MAESYRGLTISIGGDTTKLTKALHTANTAIAGTQGELRKLGQAMKLDPTNVNAAKLQLGAMAAQATNTAARMLTLNDALEQIGNKEIDGTKIKDLAENTRSAQLSAAVAINTYNGLTKSLAEVHTEITKLGKEALAAKMPDITEALDFDKLASGEVTVKEMARTLRELPSFIKPGSEAIKEFEQSASAIQKRFAEAKTEAGKLAAAGDFDELRNKLIKAMEPLYNHESGNTAASQLKRDLESMAGIIDIPDEKIAALVNRARALTPAFKQAEAEAKKFKEVAEFSDLQAEAAKTSASLVSMSKALASLDVPSEAARKVADVDLHAKSLGDSLSASLSELSSLDSALKLNPNNVDLIARKSEVMAQAQQMAAEQAGQLEKKMKEYDVSAIEKVRDTTMSVKEQAIQASDAYEAQSAVVSDLAARIEMLNEKKGKELEKKGTKEYNPQQVGAYTKKINELNDELEEATKRESDLQRVAELLKQALNLDEDQASLANIIATVDKLDESAGKLSKVDITPNLDSDFSSRLSGVSKGLSDIANMAAGLKSGLGDGGLADEIRGLDTALQDAKKRVKELDDAVKKDPGNQSMIAERNKAIAEAIALAKTQQDKLNQAIAAIPADKINEAAIKEGMAATNLENAKKGFDKTVESMKAYQASLKGVSDELDKLLKKPNKTERDIEDIRRLSQQYDSLQQSIARCIEQGDLQFEELIGAQVTQNVVEMRTQVTSLDGTLAELGKTVDETHVKDATPKIDQAAFMQAVQMVTQAARRMASEVIQSSYEIDAAYRDMTKTVQGTEEELNKLKQSAIDYSQSHVTSADTMLEMQALGGQLGILQKDLEEFGVITSNLDIATNIDAETIALQLGQVANVLDLDIDGMQGFSDALVRLGNNMPTQESNIMNIAQRFAAVANTANFSGSEILGWAAAIASTGQRSEMAATAIGNTVSAIEQATANGGADLKQFAAIAQMSADDFKTAWKNDPTEALKAFIEGLKTLKDSDTGAVAALENMGITGVRQQQTLLGLSNTIDKLDDAIRMSEDAWNGVTDKWGQAGDAAIEAEKKSQGFSGALDILKNNAKDLAQVFGDSLVYPMKVAALMMQTFTDAIRLIPAPLMSVITLTGSAKLAFSLIVPTVQRFSSGLGTLVGHLTGASTAVSTFGSAAGGAATGTAALGTAAEGAAAGTAALESSVVLGAASVAGYAAAIAVLVTSIADWYNDQETLRKATEGFSETFDGMQEGIDSYKQSVNGMGNLTQQVADIVERGKKQTEEQANLARELKEAWREVGTNVATVEELGNTIERLTGKSELARDEQNELTAAVKAYNEMTGDNVRVIDAQTGELDKSTDAIGKNIEAWKQKAEFDAKYEEYAKVVKERVKIEQELADARKAYLDVLSGTSQMEEDANENLAIRYTLLGNANNQQEEVNQTIKDYEDKLAAAKEREDELFKGMGSSTEEVSKLRAALIAAGESTEDFDSLTDEMRQNIADNWGGSIDYVIKKVAEMKAEMSDAGSIADDLAEKSKAALKKLYNDTKKQYTADEKEHKRHLDQKYKDQQREFERETKLLQRQYDQEYKAQQRKFNTEYKHAQQEYDKAYKLAQKDFDRVYKEFQKELDKRYKAKQKALDKEYDAVKDNLDDEYKARKKQYDAELKELKKAQEAEVDAFNKATDAKLKAMEREYKEKVRLLELEYGQIDSGLEDEIKRLDAETEAEKKAIEERNENDKIADLQRDVEKANSRRKRAEAEKALNDYLQEIEQKHNEESRAAEKERIKEQQDALKDELQQRKEALKEQYDAEVEAYKEKRATELDALKEANDLEYEARKEYYDGLLEQLKAANEAQLEAIKEAQSAELEALKEAQSTQLESLKESQSEQLQAIKDSQTEALENLKENQQEELNALKQGQQEKMDEIKKENQEKLDELKAANQEEIDNEKKKHDEKLQAIKDGNEAVIAEVKDNGKKMVGEMTETEKRSVEIAERTGENYKKGLEKYKNPISAMMWAQAQNIRDAFDDPQKWSGESGDNAGKNFYNSLQSWVGPIGAAAMNIASAVAGFIHFSVPDKGPLRDEDEWGGHLVQNLIDGMRSKEGELVRQVENMARAVEEGFDPTLTVDAAYEAIDTISKGRSAHMAQVMSETKDQAIEINVSISDVSVRSSADIDRLADEVSRRMADQLRRQRAGRL